MNFDKLSRDRQLSLKARRKPENDDELYDYIKLHWGIEFPRKAACPHCTAPFTVLSDSYFARYRTGILKASRGSGKSSLLSTLTLTEMVSLNTEVMILGASLVQSLKILEYIKGDTGRFPGCFWDCENAPKWLLNEKEDLKEQVWTIPDAKGVSGCIKCFTASPKAVRGQRPTRLRCDEIDEADLDIIESALGCPKNNEVSGIKANTLLSSTHQHVEGTLSHYIERFDTLNRRAGKIIAPIYTFCFRDVAKSNGGYLSDEEMEEIRLTCDPVTWQTEYLNGEPPRDQLMFTKEDLDYMFDEGLGEGVYEGRAGELVSLPPITDVYCEYAIGSDWARKKDLTVFTALACNPNQEGPDVLVGYQALSRIPWPEQCAFYDDFCARHEPYMAIHDATGNVAVGDLINCDSDPFIFSSKSKKPLIDALILAIQQRKIKCPKIRTMEKEFRALDFQKCYGDKHLPDCVASLALAWHARQRLNPINIDAI